MNRLPCALVCTFSSFFTAYAPAAVTLDLLSVDNSSQLSGYNTFELEFITPAGDWGATALLLKLSSGWIYQDPVGDNQPLRSPLSSEFDTYVGLPNSSVAGGAGDLERPGRVHGLEFSTSMLNVSFYNLDKNDIGNIPLGRITLSDNAVGSWSMLTGTGIGDISYLHTGSISNGIIVIDSETITASTRTAVSIKDPDSRALLLTKYVTDEVRELAGNGYPGESAYEAALFTILYEALLEEASNPGTPGYERLQGGVYVSHKEDYIYTEAEYLQLIDTITLQSNTPSQPEPGALSLLALGSLALLRQPRRR